MFVGKDAGGSPNSAAITCFYKKGVLGISRRWRGRQIDGHCLPLIIEVEGCFDGLRAKGEAQCL